MDPRRSSCWGGHSGFKKKKIVKKKRKRRMRERRGRTAVTLGDVGDHPSEDVTHKDQVQGRLDGKTPGGGQLAGIGQHQALEGVLLVQGGDLGQGGGGVKPSGVKGLGLLVRVAVLVVGVAHLAR